MSGLHLSSGHARRRRWPVVALMLVLACAAVVVWWFTQRGPGPEPTARAFAAAWDDGDPAAAALTVAPATAREDYEAIVADLDADGPQVTLTDVSEPDEQRTAIALLEIRWSLPGDRTWTYETSAEIVRDGEQWAVAFDAATVHPELTDGARLATSRTTPERADILGARGGALVTDRPVVDIGVQPSRVDDVDALTDALREVLDIDAEGLEGRIEDAASPDLFVEVITLREDDYDEVADELRELDGPVFRAGELPLAPTASFARPLLGRTGPVTAELLDEYPERYELGDEVGLSGLQRRYDERLFGEPGIEVVATPAAGDADRNDDPDDDGDQDPSGDAGPEVLFAEESEPGDPLVLSLDESVQRAAEDALADVEQPSALVAIDVADGRVRAVANGPGTEGLDIATKGQYPPGSTFKIVTAAALLDQGLTVDDTVACPQRITVDGRAFGNAEDAELGEVAFREAFAQSCNTAFIGEVEDLEAEALREAATGFGLGAEAGLGVGAFRGEVPVTEPGTDQAAAAIGQGRVLASPLAMADVAATVARGEHLPPSLVLDPDPAAEPEGDEETGDGAEEGEDENEEIGEALLDTLDELMRAVVTEGSGGAVADVPGGEVHGKTGTAEYGDETPRRTHTWFVGSQDELAFAVLVAETDGGFGGELAAPVAAEFLTGLAE